MNRRTQTARHRPSQSLASDDLGYVRETDSEVGSSIEEKLRSDLTSAKQEIGKLKGQVETLQKALKERPPPEEIQTLSRELQNLELLLHGTQKENERATSELERLKNREKLMERELKRLIGEDWEETLNIGGRYSPARPAPSVSSAARNMMIKNDNSSTISFGTTNPSVESNAALLAYVEQIRTMLTGMDERLQLGQKNIQAVVERAEAEKQQLQEMLKQESDVVPS
ncbi:hypothetical protein Clacol_007480 [Clathrus columnatus]|uniref:Uncharacterized protein n=1 Tax=Clathrus columnatus TaxID=1419009 RepID=A0AAV5AF20_9AGAM|nr:hypothetical protein Clacol_007480 [Clathrus columnatus]